MSQSSSPVYCWGAHRYIALQQYTEAEMKRMSQARRLQQPAQTLEAVVSETVLLRRYELMLWPWKKLESLRTRLKLGSEVTRSLVYQRAHRQAVEGRSGTGQDLKVYVVQLASALVRAPPDLRARVVAWIKAQDL